MKNPCENCPNRQKDNYGLLCDLSCGKHSAYVNYQAGIKEVVDWIRGYYTNSDCSNWSGYSINEKDLVLKMKEWGIE